MKRKSDLADKIKRCVRARELGKKHYTKHRDLLEQIAHEIKPGREVMLGDGTKATLIDQFAEKTTVFRPLGVSRYEMIALTALVSGEVGEMAISRSEY